MTDAAIEIRDLEVQRGGRPVLDRFTLSVPRGRLVGLLGPSGSGKTTLLRCIVGVQVVAHGDVTVLDLPAGSRGLRHRVAYVTQAPSVYEDLDGRENLAYFARVLSVAPERVDEVIETVGLTAVAGTRVGSLSGGERARVSLAVALLGRPELLVLDEPTVGLDPVLRRDLWQTFRRITDAGATLLVSSHVMDEAARCEQLVLLRDGAILATGAPAELLHRTGARDLEEAFLVLVDRLDEGGRA